MCVSCSRVCASSSDARARARMHFNPIPCVRHSLSIKCLRLSIELMNIAYSGKMSVHKQCAFNLFTKSNHSNACQCHGRHPEQYEMRSTRHARRHLHIAAINHVGQCGCVCVCVAPLFRSRWWGGGGGHGFMSTVLHVILLSRGAQHTLLWRRLGALLLRE